MTWGGHPPAAQSWLRRAQRCESAGFDALLASDHPGSGRSLFGAPAAAAAVTSTLGLGSHVSNRTVREPLLLAALAGRPSAPHRACPVEASGWAASTVSVRIRGSHAVTSAHCGPVLATATTDALASANSVARPRPRPRLGPHDENDVAAQVRAARWVRFVDHARGHAAKARLVMARPALAGRALPLERHPPRGCGSRRQQEAPTARTTVRAAPSS